MSYLCPVCRSTRETDLRDTLSAFTHIQIIFITGAISAIVYFWAGLMASIKSTLFYLPLWAGAEFLHWARMRQAAKCEVCGFDPILYRRNPLEARRQVELRLNAAVTDLKGQLKALHPSKKPVSNISLSPPDSNFADAGGSKERSDSKSSPQAPSVTDMRNALKKGPGTNVRA